MIGHFTLTSQQHNDYGCSYPATYAFRIPAGSSGLIAKKRITSGGAWSPLTEKLVSDVFSGIEAVRFDYTNNFAYVSAAFDASSDDLWLDVLNGASTVGTFLRVAPYYDNRTTGVVLTWDDWYGDVSPSSVTGNNRNDEHLAMVQAHAARGLWATCGICPGGALGISPAPDWAKVNTATATGFMEPVNHSWDHKDANDNDWDASVATTQITAAAAAIKVNANIPSVNTKGSTEYVPGFICPYGHINDFVKAALGASKHLTLGRNTNTGSSKGETHPGWDSTFGAYGQVAQTIEPTSATTAATMNAAFDAVKGLGRTYIVHTYPYWWDWSNPAAPILAHLDHIAGDASVWYVGLGDWFLYRYITDRVLSV